MINIECDDLQLTDAAHQNTTLAVKVRVNLLLKGGLVCVASTDGNSKSASLLVSLE